MVKLGILVDMLTCLSEYQEHIQDLPQGVDHGECRRWAYNGGLDAEPLVGSPLELKPFVHFHTNKDQKLRI